MTMLAAHAEGTRHISLDECPACERRGDWRCVPTVAHEASYALVCRMCGVSLLRGEVPMPSE